MHSGYPLDRVQFDISSAHISSTFFRRVYIKMDCLNILYVFQYILAIFGEISDFNNNISCVAQSITLN